MDRRQLLRHAPSAALLTCLPTPLTAESAPTISTEPTPHVFDVRVFGATGDGTTIDSPAVNRAIKAASSAGGGTVLFPAGIYACYTIRLKSHITLQLEAGATILAAETRDGKGYDAAGPKQPWESYQDFGHNHWANSLIYGEGLEGVAITGRGLIWGKGLSRGAPREQPRAEDPGVGNKAIALKNCHNVLLRDFSILMGGHFGILLTGVDNVVIDALTIDTNRDGMDIDCCRNVRVSNCAVNSPWDDGICPKSSFALGYARSTENVTISNCYVTGKFVFGTMLDGTWKLGNYEKVHKAVGRIKCGTESNGGFKNITISNCILDGCRGIALESVDGAQLEDIAITNITLRDVVHSPFFLRLGTRMRGPADAKPGTLRRILISNVVSHGAVAEFPSIIAGVENLPIEDVKLSDLYLHSRGGGSPEWAALQPPENDKGYPDAHMFGTLPASGFFIRHARNLEITNVEIRTEAPDARAAIWGSDVDGLDVFRLKIAKDTPAFNLTNVRDFRSFSSAHLRDIAQSKVDKQSF